MERLRDAAVIVAVCADPPHRVVFIERAAHLRRHPGQIGLPGGIVDRDDGDDRGRTALRELWEELGVPPDRVRLVGTLPIIVARSTGDRVTPLVGVLAPHTPLAIDPAETAAVFTVPLAALLAPGAVHPGIETVGELTVDTWIFDHGDRHIWGLTGRILRDFAAACAQTHGPLRRALEAALADGRVIAERTGDIEWTSDAPR